MQAERGRPGDQGVHADAFSLIRAEGERDPGVWLAVAVEILAVKEPSEGVEFLPGHWWFEGNAG